MIVAIVGPTAAGKTAVSVELAERLGGADVVEIVSADAMQLYRGMDIGTAKASVAERRGIAHHQLDVLDVREEASVAAYQRHARADLEGILERGKIPVVVGGSGLYVSGLLDELEFPGRSPKIRAELEAELETGGIGPLLGELRDKDPQAAESILPSNTRRIIRALEVIRLTGGRFTARFPRHTSHYPGIRSFALMRGTEAMAEAIEKRTAAMLAEGLVEETRELLRCGLGEGRTARTATGYAQAIAVIEGRMSEEEAADSIGAATRRLARKQRTWFRADPRLTWLDLTDADASRAASAIAASLGL